jgi:hypothetical protein
MLELSIKKTILGTFRPSMMLLDFGGLENQFAIFEVVEW